MLWRPLVICLIVIAFRTTLHILGVQMCILVGDAYVRILLLLTDREEVCFCVVTLIWHRLAIFTLLL